MSTHSIAAEFSHEQAPEAAEQMARDILGLRTLETRNSDSQDFHEIAVWQLRAALEAAFSAGVETALAAADQAEEHAAEASAPAKQIAPPTPDSWLVMESGARGSDFIAAIDSYAEAVTVAEERAAENHATSTDAAVWVQPVFAFQQTL